MRSKVVASVLASVLVFAACKSGDSGSGGPKLRILSPRSTSTIAGNIVTLDLDASGIDIVKAADGDTSGKNGHFHVFVNQVPVKVGEEIPAAPSIIHTTDDPVIITGLPIGEHSFVVVIGDSTHKRITNLLAGVTVRVKGPSVDIDIPSNDFAAGQDVFLAFTVQGVSIVKAAEDPGSATTGHLHVYVDPESAPTADGKPIPATDKIIHIADTKHILKGLAPGAHTIWLVLGDKNHVPFSPLVADKIVINIK